MSTPHIIIDIGHARGTGARGNDQEEHDRCTKIAAALQRALTAHKLRVSVLDYPELSNSADLTATAAAANATDAALGVSLHMDAASLITGRPAAGPRRALRQAHRPLHPQAHDRPLGALRMRLHHARGRRRHAAPAHRRRHLHRHPQLPERMIIPLLADISPEDVGKIIITIIGVAGGGYGVFALGKHKSVKVDPQPLDVRTLSPYATRDELRDLERKHDDFEREIRTTLRDGEQRSHKRMDALASKIDESLGLQKANTATTNKILDVLLHPHHDD